tara:strand:- start:1763 stop:2056 length:294 start_codon:yes stop_codon:yes gene_type:complete
MLPSGNKIIEYRENYANVTVREYLGTSMKHTTESIGALIRETRKAQGLTQENLAMTSGTGLRFIIDLEKGKPTCQFAKVIHVLQMLGISIELTPPEL